MKRPLDIRFFVHSLVSDWNHGNAHFLRGLVRALGQMGHRVRSYEQLGAWSLSNLVSQEHERSIDAINQFRHTYHELDIQFYQDDAELASHMRAELNGADIVIIHEWNEPHIVNMILGLKEELGFRALFHDTHHRAYTIPRDILRFHLHKFDGVLAFGEAIRRIYRDGFGMQNAFTFHEAAAIDTFRPVVRPQAIDVVWIGNWADDDERTDELREFLLEPAAAAPGRKTVVYGVRYPEAGVRELQEAGIDYRGYLPNLEAPQVYGESALTVHIPRRPYANGVSGVPTIRIFEALACGIPLISAPWEDAENLFRAGEDFIVVRDQQGMKAEMDHLLRDVKARRQIGVNGLETVRRRHTCAHRAEQLTAICEELLS
jgi:spore maturation protein CgeB